MKTRIILALLFVTLLVAPATLAQDAVTITFWHTYNEISPENETLTESNFTRP